jgi:hypothetical protein
VRFKDYLREAKHRQDVSVEKAEELLRANCKDALMHFATPMWRGSKNSQEEAYLINGEAGGRESANSTNHYTILMDEFLPRAGYPKRGASIICTNNEGKSYARTYGYIYALFPYDGVKIGVCDEQDIWEHTISIGGSSRKPIEKWNMWFDSHEIPDYSYHDLVQGINDTLDNPDDAAHDEFVQVFGKDSSKVKEILEEAYSPHEIGVHLATTKTMHEYEDHGRECWVGGKVIALSYITWEKFLKKFEIKV